jgi:2-methylcitrate dehydratase PrpD
VDTLGSIAAELANWVIDLEPSAADLELAERSLLDTIAVAVAARNEPIIRAVAGLPEEARWSVAGHVLDFDDLHMASTTHVSVVCVPAVLSVGGDARAYLAAAGVMARLGTAFGWSHYSTGWHATCTAGALAAAVGSGVALKLNAGQLATAMALAVPGGGGVQRAFGTDAKSLQVGFATAAGVRAARLAGAGVSADVSAVDFWFELLGGQETCLDLTGPAIPGGLAIKIFPCCYALQRPISALVELAKNGLDSAKVDRIVLRTPRATVAPLIHHCPDTGLQAKFSLEYAAATALLDSHQGFSSFTDEGVLRPEARRLMEVVEVELSEGGDWLLAGELEVEVYVGGQILGARSQFPPGSPQRPPTKEELLKKVEDCLVGASLDPDSISWESSAEILRRYF